MKKLFSVIILIIFLANINQASAQSPYVLPYPSTMPGSIFYNVNLIKETLLKYWHFGNFGQFEYSLHYSDKYLVEAKTLFDYKQYLLGKKALEKSDMYFKKVYPYLMQAKNEGRDISEKLTLYKQAAEKHIEELEKMKSSTPTVFNWDPERGEKSTLKLGEAIDNSINIRK